VEISGNQWQSNLLEEAPHLLLTHAVDAIRGGLEGRRRVVEQRGLARGDHLMREIICFNLARGDHLGFGEALLISGHPVALSRTQSHSVALSRTQSHSVVISREVTTLGSARLPISRSKRPSAVPSAESRRSALAS